MRISGPGLAFRGKPGHRYWIREDCGRNRLGQPDWQRDDADPDQVVRCVLASRAYIRPRDRQSRVFSGRNSGDLSRYCMRLACAFSHAGLCINAGSDSIVYNAASALYTSIARVGRAADPSPGTMPGLCHWLSGGLRGDGSIAPPRNRRRQLAGAYLSFKRRIG